MGKGVWIALCAGLLLACGGAGKEKVELDAGADLAAETTVPVDVAADLADGVLPPDVEPTDVPPEELPPPPDVPEPDLADVADVEDVPPPPDVQPDLPPDLTPYPELAFRVDSMTVQSPQFCYPIGETCMPVNDMLNGALAQALADHEMHLVGRFAPFAPDETGTLTFGPAECNLDDPPSSELPLGSCTFEAGTIPAVYDAVTLQSEGHCDLPLGGGGIMDAPCFSTGEDDLALELYGAVLGLSNVSLTGTIDTWPPGAHVAPGLLHGYLPEKIAKTVEVFIPGDPPLAVPVYDLLKDCPTPSEIVDGHKAWPVIIDFEASEVGFLE